MRAAASTSAHALLRQLLPLSAAEVTASRQYSQYVPFVPASFVQVLGGLTQLAL